MSSELYGGQDPLALEPRDVGIPSAGFEGEPVTERGWPTGSFCAVGTQSRRPHNHELCLKMWPPSAVEEWESGWPVIKVKLLSAQAAVPRPAYKDDAGLDLTAVSGAVVRVGNTMRVNLDVAVQLPDGFSAFLMGRSSMFGRGLLVMQTLIDCGYRGELFAMVYNFGQRRQVIAPGERIAQLVPWRSELPSMKIKLVAELDPSERGGNGFGSTGR